MIDDDILGVEVFPTHLRSTAMAVTLVAARLGAICGNEIFGQLLGINCAIPIIMVAALMIGGINTVRIFQTFSILSSRRFTRTHPTQYHSYSSGLTGGIYK